MRTRELKLGQLAEGVQKQAKALAAVVIDRVSYPHRKERERSLATQGLMQISRALYQQVDGIRQGELPNYTLSLVDPTQPDTAITLQLDDNLIIGYGNYDAYIRYDDPISQVQSRFIFSQHSTARGKIINDAYVLMDMDGESLRYPLSLKPNRSEAVQEKTERQSDAAFAEDRVARQLARNILGSAALLHEGIKNAVELSTADTDNRATLPDTDDEQRFYFSPVDYLKHVPFPQFVDYIPPIEPYTSRMTVSETTAILPSKETKENLIHQLITVAGDMTHLGILQPQDLPYFMVDPQLATYVAQNSIAVYAESKSTPIGIVSAQPEAGTLMFQVLSGEADYLPTVYFTNPHQTISPENVQTLQIGYAPFCNPYDIGHTFFFPVTKAAQESSLLVAQRLLQRLSVDSNNDFPLPMYAMNGMPYVGIEQQSLFSFAMDALKAPFPPNFTTLRTDFYDRTHRKKKKSPTVPDYAIGLYQKGQERETLIWFDEKRGTTTIDFEVSSGEAAQKQKTTVSFDSDGLRINGVLITQELLATRSGWNNKVARMRKALYLLEDAWTLVQDQQHAFITDQAKEDINDLLDYLWAIINHNGIMPFMTPYQTGKANTFIVQDHLPVPSDVVIEDGLMPLGLLDADVESYPEETMLGYLAMQAREQRLATNKTSAVPSAPPPDIYPGTLYAADLVDEREFLQSPLMKTITDETTAILANTMEDTSQEETDTQPSTPSVGKESKEDTSVTSLAERLGFLTSSPSEEDSFETKRTTKPLRRGTRRKRSRSGSSSPIGKTNPRNKQRPS